MKKSLNNFYFPHDYNAANDQKILMIRSKFNNVFGYGIYFMILESMAQTDEGYIEEDMLEGLCLSYGIAIAQLQAIINYAININLFEKKGKKIFSKRMIIHKKFRKERVESGRKGAINRWKNYHSSANGSANSSANGSPMAQPMQIKGNKSKVNKRKEKINKKENFDKDGFIVRPPLTGKALVDLYGKEEALKILQKRKGEKNVSVSNKRA